MSVPFASRTRTEPDQLGNRSGVIPVKLPTGGGFSDRLTAVSAIMRAAKQQERGASTAVLGPLFRLLARLGGYQYFIDHQSFVHTFVSNLRGPDAPINLLGCRVLDVVPLSVATGNITGLLHRPLLRQPSSHHHHLRPEDMSGCRPAVQGLQVPARRLLMCRVGRLGVPTERDARAAAPVAQDFGPASESPSARA